MNRSLARAKINDVWTWNMAMKLLLECKVGYSCSLGSRADVDEREKEREKENVYELQSIVRLHRKDKNDAKIEFKMS